MKVLVLLHAAQSVPGRLAQSLAEQHCQVSVLRYCLGEPLPASLDAFDGLVVMGGPMSAHDPQLASERRLIDRFLATGKPYLGICLGAQLMNLAYGGRVAPCEDGQVQMGWHRIVPLSSKFERLDWVYQWHSDWIEPPSTLEVPARDARGRVQAVVNQSHHGVQFHPEADEDVRRRWLARAAHKLVGPGAHPASQHHEVGQHQDAKVTAWLADYLQHWRG